MFLILKVKTKVKYCVPMSKIPYEAFSLEGCKQGLYISYFLTETDCMSNLNTNDVVINSTYIQKILQFDKSITTNPYNKYLVGTGAIVVLKSNCELFVADKFEDILKKLKAV